MKQNLFGNAFFMVCLSALLAACGKQEQPVRPQPVVRVARAEAIASEAARSYTFISEPVRVTQLAFRVGGPVDNFTVQAGQFFRQGQPIFMKKTTYRPLPMRKLVLTTLVLVQISIWP